MSTSGQGKPLNLGQRTDADEIVRRWQIGSPDEHWNVQLTPSVGSLSPDTVGKLEPNTKIMISAINKVISKLPAEQQNWDGLIAALSNNVLIKQQGEEHNSSSVYTSSDSKLFGMVGVSKSSDTIKKEVLDWYNQLINDSKVLNINRMSIDEAAEIVAYSAETVSYLDQLKGQKYQEQEMIELGVLRYPDENDLTFSVYKISLIAWSDWKKHMFQSIHTSGIRGVFLLRKFVPNEETMNALSAEVRNRVVKEVDELLSAPRQA